MKAIKELGQHFLNDASIADAIADLADIHAGEPVWEIGPGPGILTGALLNKGAELTAFELDPRMATVLEERFGSRLNLVLMDILKVDWETELKKYPVPIKLVANIPYQITSPLLYHLQRYSSYFESVVMMMQQEVAWRLSAKPGTKSYGLLTLRLGLSWESSIEIMVGKQYFDPIPMVDSAVVKMLPRRVPAPIKDLELYYRLLTYSFAHKRKTLRNNLIPMLGKDRVHKLEQTSGLDFGRRAETIDEVDFILLSDLVPAL